MTLCLAVLELLEAGKSPFPPYLAEHVNHCSACQSLVAAWPHLQGVGNTVRFLSAPRKLVEAVVHIPRLPQSCEAAVITMAAVLDREAAESERQDLLNHLQTCFPCRSTWESLATLKQVGTAVTSPSSLTQRLAAVPLPKVTPGARRARLAAAALYLLAGTLALATGQENWFAREVSAKVGTAFFYGRAAVANRVNWAEKHFRSFWHQTQQFARYSLSQAFAFWRQSLSPKQQNPRDEKSVCSPEEGAKS